MNKVLGIISIICAALLVVGVGILCLGKGLGGSNAFDFSFVNGKLIGSTREMVENTVDTESFTTLETDVVSAKVYIQKGSTNQVYYKLDEVFDVEITNENGTLKVTQKGKENSFFIMGEGEENVIEITVADADMLNVNLKSESGGTVIEDLALEGTINTNSGSVSINNAMESGELSLEQESGSTTVSNSTFTNLKLDKTSGSIKLSDVDADILDMYSVSGSQKVSSSNIADFNTERESGSLEVSNCVLDEVNARATSGSTKFNECEIGNYTGETVSGSTTLYIKGQESDYNYKFDITSGSLKINDNSMDREYDKDNGSDKTIDIEATSGSTKIDFYQ